MPDLCCHTESVMDAGIDPRYRAAPLSDPGEVPPGWVRMDFHMHTYGSGDAVTTVDEFGASVASAGLDVVCVTDHNALYVAQALRSDLDVRVIIGQEVKTQNGELIGLFCTELVSFGLPSIQTARNIQAQGGIVYVPHPIGPRANAMSERAMDLLLAAGNLDAVEVFNARNLQDRMNDEAALYATTRGLPGGVGSDAHYPDEIGTAWLVLPDFDSPRDLIEAMWSGRVVGERSLVRPAWRPRIVPPSTYDGALPDGVLPSDE